jgi:hypothetical protein
LADVVLALLALAAGLFASGWLLRHRRNTRPVV